MDWTKLDPMVKIYGDEVHEKIKELDLKKKSGYKDLSLILKFGRYLIPYWQAWIQIFICMMFSALLSLPGPFITKLIIDRAIPDKNFFILIILTLLGIFMYFIKNAIGFIQSWISLICNQRIILDMRLDFFEHIQRLPIECYKKIRAGELTSRIFNDVGGVQGLLAGTFLQLIQNIFLLLIGGAAIFYLNYRLAVLCLLIIPFYLASYAYLGKRSRAFSKLLQEKKADLFGHVQERMSGAMEVKSFVKEKFEAIKFVRLSRGIINLTVRQTIFGSISGFVSGFVRMLGPTIITFYGAVEVMRGNLSLGGLFAFLSLIGYVYGPAQRIFQTHLGIQASLASADRMMEILDITKETEIETGSNNKGIRPEEIRGDVTFKNVCFSYVEGKWVLKNINLNVSAGMTIGIAGPSGVGKTTIVNLISRFYKPLSGNIFIDEYDINELDLRTLRRNIAIVPQEVFLFSGSIRENIKYGNQRTTEEEMIHAAKLAQIHDFILELPEGYDTQIGERGARLSGGQRQRIAIARAVLCNPRILILDEATSFLDSDTERRIQEALADWMASKTVFIITHRLSTLVNVDKIIVLDGGNIVEEGTLEVLLASKGLYAKLYHQQTQHDIEQYTIFPKVVNA